MSPPLSLLELPLLSCATSLHQLLLLFAQGIHLNQLFFKWFLMDSISGIHWLLFGQLHLECLSMPPKVRVCLCRSHSCMDEVCHSQVVGQYLKGRYLSDTKFQSHQWDEIGFSLSGQSETLPRWQLIPSESSQTLPSTAPPFATFSRVSDASFSCPSLTEKLFGQDQDWLDWIQPSVDGHTPNFAAAKQGHILGNHSAETPTIQRGFTQEDCIMQAIEGCHFDFQSSQHADISSDELIFEETPTLKPPPHLTLRRDALSNMGFIEYEEMMFNLLDIIEKIKTGGNQQCDITKQNIFSSVKDELHRLWGLKEHSWKTQAMSASSVFPAWQMGPFRESSHVSNYLKYFWTL